MNRDALKGFSRIARQVLGLLLAVLVIRHSGKEYQGIIDSLGPPMAYWKDCIQPFLMAKAVLNGVDPYTPLPQLAARWLEPAHPAHHPTPYPPFVAVLSLPLGFFTYEKVAALWLIGEAICLLATLLLLLRFWGTSWNPVRVLVLFALVLLWTPVSEELRQGQFMSGLLLFLTGAWLALRNGKEILGGVLLGFMISIKLMAWPIVLFLAMRRRFRSVGAAMLTILGAHVIASAVLGLGVVANYYLEVGPLNARLWRPAEGNYSAWAWGIRLFQGAGFSFHLTPLEVAPRLAAVATYLLPLSILVAFMFYATRDVTFDTSFSLLVGASLLVSPIFWHFYLLLAVVPGVILVQRLRESGFPAESSILAGLGVIAVSIPPSYFERLSRSFGNPLGQGEPIVAFGPGLHLLTPVAALIGLLWLVWRTDGMRRGAPDSLLQS